MKKIGFLVLVAPLIFASCGIDKAEKIADEFHAKLDAHDYDYIVDNICDEELIAEEGKDGMLGFFELVESWGQIKNRQKETGFSQQTRNGVTTVRLDYTFDNDMGKFYEGIVLVDRGEGYKLLTVIMDMEKGRIDQALADF